MYNASAEVPAAIQLPLRPWLVKQIMDDRGVSRVHIPDQIRDVFVLMATYEQPVNQTVPNPAAATCMLTTGKTAVMSCYTRTSQSACEAAYDEILYQKLASACEWDASIGVCMRAAAWAKLC